MAQWFKRGYEFNDGFRIRKLVSFAEDWQIYETNESTFVLAVSSKLIDFWKNNYDLNEDLFSKTEDYYCIIGSKNSIICSLSQGPFPSCDRHAKAFADTFVKTRELYPEESLDDAIFVQDYLMLLPWPHSCEDTPDNVLCGRWLSGGVSIAVDSDNFSKINPWVDGDILFKLSSAEKAKEDEEADAEHIGVLAKEKNSKAAGNKGTGEPFKLLGRPELEAFFNNNIIDIVNNAEKYKKMGIDFPGATVLYGPPGCGKTYAVDRLSEYLDWPRFDISSETVASPYIHDTGKKISEVFNKAIESSPSILVIDEMESFLSSREGAGSNSNYRFEEVAEFLRRIPEAIEAQVLIFAMTNMIDSIDPAIIRRGRFDYIIEVKMPSAEEIACLLSARFSELPVSSEVSAEAIAKKLELRPMSDVTFLLREAGRRAVKEEKSLIDNECFDFAFNQFPKKDEPKRTIGF